MVLRGVLWCVLAVIALKFLAAVLHDPDPGAIAGDALVYGFLVLVSIAVYRRMHAGDRVNMPRQK